MAERPQRAPQNSLDTHRMSYAPSFGAISGPTHSITNGIEPGSTQQSVTTGDQLMNRKPKKARPVTLPAAHKPVNPLDGLDDAISALNPEKKDKERKKQNRGSNRQSQQQPPAWNYSATVEHPYSTGNMADNPYHPLMSSVHRSMESGSQGGLAGIPARPSPPMLPSPARKVITLDPAMIDRIGEVR